MKYTAHQHLDHRRSISPASHSAGTVTGDGVNVQGVDEALVYLDIGAAGTSATLDVKVQESDDDSTYTDIVGAVFSQQTEAGGDEDKALVGRLDLVGAKKYIRAIAVVAVQVYAAAIGFELVRGSSLSKELPVSQENTVEFNVTA